MTKPTKTKSELDRERINIQKAKRALEHRLGANEIVRIVDKYYKVLPEGALVPYSPTVLAKDYGKEYNNLALKYEGYKSEPSYLDYSRDVITPSGIFYNTHEPITHVPVPGAFPTIEKLLRHVFAEKYEMILDWIQIVLTNPKQHLPIPCLVSEEQGTGKTSFLRLLKILFQYNTVEVSIGDLSQRFNGHWASKNLILIDETETDDFSGRNELASKIKRYVTATTINVDEKGVPIYTIDFNGKFVVCSNREKSFLKISQADTRYWIVKVKSLGKKHNEGFFAKLETEAAAFIHFLSTREMETKEWRGRFWFSEEQYRTDAFNKAAEHNKSWLYHEILECIKTYFEDYKSLDEERFSMTTIKSMLTDSGARNWNSKWIHSTMQEDFGKIEQNNKWKGSQVRGYNFTRSEIESGSYFMKGIQKEPDHLSHNIFKMN
jgi:hypothetical protein